MMTRDLLFFSPSVKGEHPSHTQSSRSDSPASGGAAARPAAEDTQALADAKTSVRVLVDDPGIRKSLCSQLKRVGYRPVAFDSPDALFASETPAAPDCLVMTSPLANGSNCLDLLKGMADRGWNLPLVVLATRWEVKFVVKTIKAGAEDFLVAPVNPDDFLDAVARALQRSKRFQQQQQCVADATKRVSSLNPREVEILKLVLTGMLNKEIADHLNLALVTVKVYRARVMKKLGAGNAASMACIASLAGMDVQSSLSFID